jgi:glucose-6-phosphate isomerase
MQNASMQEMFLLDATRTDKFNLKWNDFYWIIQNIINQETIQLLLELADEVGLKSAIADYFDGAIINQTENRAVLHTALRAKESQIKVDGVNVVPEVYAVKNKIKAFTHEVISGSRTGFTGKRLHRCCQYRWRVRFRACNGS